MTKHPLSGYKTTQTTFQSHLLTYSIRYEEIAVAYNKYLGKESFISRRVG